MFDATRAESSDSARQALPSRPGLDASHQEPNLGEAVPVVYAKVIFRVTACFEGCTGGIVTRRPVSFCSPPHFAPVTQQFHSFYGLR